MEINLKWLFNTGCTSLENSLSFLGSYFHIFDSSPLANDRALYSKEKYLILPLSSLPTPHFVYPLCPLFCLCFYLRPTVSLDLFLMDCYLKEFMLSWFFFFPSCVTLSPSFKKKYIYLKTQFLSCGLQVLNCNTERSCVLQLRFIASKLKKKKKNLQEQSVQFFNKTTMIPEILKNY